MTSITAGRPEVPTYSKDRPGYARYNSVKVETDPKLLNSVILDHSEWYVSAAAVQNPNADSDDVDWALLNHGDWYVRACAVPSASSAARKAALLHDSDWFVRREAAKVVTDPKALKDALAGDERWTVRAAIAANPALPEKYASAIMEDSSGDWRVAASACRRPSARQESVDFMLLNWDDWRARSAAASANASPEALGKALLSEGNEKVVEAIICNENTERKALSRFMEGSAPPRLKAMARELLDRPRIRAGQLRVRLRGTPVSVQRFVSGMPEELKGSLR